MLSRRDLLTGATSLGAGVLLPIGLRGAAAAADWPQFRGAQRDNISKETGLARKWPAGGPKVLWSVPVAQGYAGAAIVGGRVYHHDYDEAKNEWCVNCRNLGDGQLVWQFRETREIRPNHAITRTVPAVEARYVFSLDPKAVLHCLDVKTGRQVWRKSLVTDFKATIPSWYNGQCPLMESDRLIIATGGSAILVALDKATGNPIWRTPNPGGVMMSHASVMPATLCGVRQYLYGTLKGPLGVSAADGRLLWEYPRKFNVAVAPSPLALENDRVFMTASYDAGSVMIRVRNSGGVFKPEPVFDFTMNEWNSEVHTPVVHKGMLFAVGKKKRGLFTCLSPEGREVWNSEGKASFGLGSYFLADGMFFVMDGDSGKLHLIEASTTGYNELASAQVLAGQEVWGPMALSGGRLVLRDLTRMICLDVRGEHG
ncbi:MAG TPA: PQQ-binding-like beta-propeller repeat protein [Bryobacteraceae bacterium]|nr:PQQ-binding-like beta-propeller repeat protein [Bryobacteraceae bacterium]